MKIAKSFTLFSCVLILSMLLTSAGVTGPTLASVTTPDGMPDALLAFNGLNRTEGDPLYTTDSWVPDTSGDVGITRYIQAVNKAVAMYTKTGTLIVSALFDEFWSGAATDTACDGNVEVNTHHGQPNVLYDHMAQRWVIMDLAYENIDTGPYYLCIAVSNHTVGEAPPDFTIASWNYYALPSQNQWPYYFPNQARIGLWPDGYYIAADLYDVYNNGLNRTLEGAKVWAVNRDDLVNGTYPFRAIPYTLTEEDEGYHGLLPSNLEGAITPPTGTPNYLTAIAPPNLFYIWEFAVDWTEEENSTFSSSPTVLTTEEPFNWIVGYMVDQPGTSEMLDIHSDRLNSVTYRIVDGVEALWASHTAVGDLGDDDLRWYELRGLSTTPYFYQQGNYAPDSNYRWISSLGVDVMGNMAIGYSISGSEMYPSVYYAGRLATDPLDTLGQGEKALAFGTGYQDMNPTTDEGPWGERSAMSLDPVDPCVFWYTNEYYVQGEPTIWRTIIGAFRYPSCMQGTTTRISLHTDGTQGNGASGVDFEAYSVSISDDGRYVAFSSEATNLVDDDTNGRRDVFVRDRDADGDGFFDEAGNVTTTRISVGWFGEDANSDSWQVSISGNGRYIAFASYASNLIAPYTDTNGTWDVFRYDQETGEMIRVSVSSAGVQGNGQSDQPSISYDGRYIAFRSYANNLVADDINDPSDIFVHDVDTATTTMVSVSTLGVQGNADSYTPSISGDGRWVAFASRATNLFPGDTVAVCNYNGDAVLDNCSDVFAYDRLYNELQLISAVDGTTTTFGDNESYAPSASYDGSRVAFASRASNLVDLNDDTIFDDDTNGVADIFVRKTVYTSTVMISVSFFGGLANADSYTPAISPDGMFVAYASDASTLDLYDDMNGVRDIFLYDMGTSLTRLISLSYNGMSSNGRSVAPDISRSGSQVTYPSRATNLVNNDTNNFWDVFAYNRFGVIPTFLNIPSNIPGHPGEAVNVPVNFDGNGHTVDSTTFSVDFDETCLTYNSTTFTLPGTSEGSVSYSATDTDGELDFAVRANTNPAVPLEDGSLAVINFTVKTSCQAVPPDGTRYVRVGFSDDPRASFGSNGQSIPGTTADGSVVVLTGYLGDCNSDGKVDAGDLTAIVLEIFDGDGNVPADVPGGTFPGNPVGCNPNQDLVVDAGDISCEVMVIFDPYASCACASCLVTDDTGVKISSLDENASLSIAAQVPGPAGRTVHLPITLATKGNPINSLVFSVDYDHTWLSYGSVTFNLPDGFHSDVSLGLNGMLNFVIYASTPGLLLPDGPIADLILTVGKPDQTRLSSVFFNYEPPVSLGNTAGESVAVNAESGSVWTFISGNFLPFTVVAP